MIGKKINQLATELAPVSTDLTIIGDPISGVSKKITLAQLGAIFSGAVSFYTNLAGFPATGDINVIYCAKDTQKLYLWSGSAYVEVFPSQALLDTYQLRSEKGVSNGYASLDSSGKVPISQLPSSIMEYKGTWNASTNTPTLANGTGDTGDVYICNVAGTVNFGAGPITFAVGDYVIYSGTIWQRSSGAVGTVTSVAASITGNAIGITGSPVTTSGTLAFAFAGTGAQYIKGDGTLATFPSTIAQAERLITEVYNSTGATLTKGTIVYINGGQGNLPTVTKALATGDSTSAQTFGVVQADITNNNNGYVVVAGKLSDLDTQAYTEGTQLYLSATTAGTWTSTKQYAPAHLVYIGIVVRAHPTQGIVEIKIQNGYELDEIHNVAAQTPTNNDGLFWESATSLWKNKSISTILGGTPITGSGNVNAIPKFTANSVLGNSVMEDDGNFVSMRGLKLNASAGVGNTINFQQGTGITAGGLGYSTIGASSTTGFIFYIDQNTTSRNFILDTSTITSDAQRTYSMPATSGTLALVSQLTGGTVTSVGLSSATSGVTIGSTPITTSGTITLAIATASGSQQGLLSSSDWTTFNNKQDALTNPVTGTGTTNYLPKFTGTSTIGNSQVFDNGTNVGIGTATPSARLDLGNNVGSANTANQISLYGGGLYGFGVSAAQLNYISGGSHSFFNTATSSVQMRLDASGNLGLGVSPSAWGSNVTALELPQSVSLYSWNASAVPQLYLGANHYWDGSTWRYKITGQASTLYYQAVGQHQWFNAPSGTAGNAISFTQAMTLNASGNLSIGNTNDSYKLDVSGTGRFSASQVDILLNASSTSQYSRLVYLENGAEKGGVQYINSAFSTTARRNKLEIFNSGGIAFITQGAFASPDLLIASTGAATFSSSVTAGGKIFTSASVADNIIEVINSDTTNGYGLYVRGGGTASNRYVARFKNGADSDVMWVGTSNVGIGTTSPSAKLDVQTSTAGYAAILTNTNGASDSNGLLVRAGSVSSEYVVRFAPQSDASTFFTVKGNGNVGIGTTSPSALLHIAASGSDPVLISNSGASSYNSLILSNNNDYKIAIGIGGGSVGGNLQDNGYIGTISNRDLLFNTNNTERIRITSGGSVCIGVTSPTNSQGLFVYRSNFAAAFQTDAGTGQEAVRFFNGSTAVGTIATTGSSTAYNTSSDYRLKTDFKDFSGLDLVSKIKAYDYEWKSDKSRSYGVIAHELQSVINYAVTGVKDGKEMQGVDYSKIVPVLIKAIQEQQQQIEQLKNK